MNVLKAGVLALALGIGAAAIAESAEAARLGGGRSIGVSRPITQRQASPAQQKQAAQASPQQVAQPAAQPNRWLGPLAGLAAGLGLGWLFAQGGMGPMLAGLLVAAAAIGLIMLLARPRRHAVAAGADAGSMHDTGLGNETVAAPPPSQMPAGEDWSGALPSSQPRVPAGFDTAAFIKEARLNFIRLQEANDQAQLQTLRDMTTDVLYEQLAADIRHRAIPRHTDVVTLEASLLEVATGNHHHRASLRFSGQVSESAGSAPVPFAQVWHLSKPVSGETGWLVAGIEQLS